jgi:nitroreductase
MNQTLEVIQSLRTVHGDFDGPSVSEEDLNAIIDSALRAANASARQAYSIILVDDKQEMQSLFGYSGSHAMVFCVDYTRLKDTAAHMGYRFDEDDISGFLTGAVDAVLASQTAVIAAKSLGIDSLVTNGMFRKIIDEVYRILKLPQESCFPLIAVVFGYRLGDSEPKKGRLSREFLVHRNEYRRLSPGQIDESIAEYDDEQKRLGLMDDWAVKGYGHYLEWFFKEWSGQPSGEKKYEGKIKELQERLEKTGFWLSRPVP